MIGPGVPARTGRPSTVVTAIRPPAVEVTNTSSAARTRAVAMDSDADGMPSSAHSSSTVRRVMPSRTPAPGVARRSRSTMNTLKPGPSAMSPLPSTTITVSAPVSYACINAISKSSQW